MLKQVQHDGRANIRAFCSAAFISLLVVARPLSAAPLDPLGDPAIFKRDLEDLNRKPLPDEAALARAVGAAVAVDARQRGRCAPNRISLGKLAPVSLDGMITTMIAKGQIENGWLVPVTLDDCPPADPIRVLLLLAADGRTLQGIFAGQGTSYAWPSLSREALRGAVNAALKQLRTADSACNPRDITPTGMRIAGSSADLGPDVYGIRLKGSWNEIWTFEPCGHRIAVPIAFRTNGNGGAYWDIDDAGVLYTP